MAIGTLALKNLKRNKTRTALTLLSVASALLLLCLLWAFLEAMQSVEGADDTRVVVRSAISLATLLPEAYWQKIRTIPHVQAVTPLNWYQGTFKDDRPENFFPRFATDPATLFEVFPEYQMPDDQKKAWAAERGSFIAGKELVDKYSWKIGSPISIKGDIYPFDLTNIVLRGIYTVPNAPVQERQIFFHRQYLEEAIGNRGLIGTYFLRLDTSDSVPTVVTAAEKMFENSDSQVRAETEKAFNLSFLEMIGNIRLLFGAIGLAVVISIFFITANTMAMSARERTGEMAVLKTLGFGGGQVMSLVVIESLAVGIAGALLGCGLAFGLVGALAKAAEKVFPVFSTISMTPKIWGIGLGVGIAIGLLAGLVPAIAASRLRIADALRRV